MMKQNELPVCTHPQRDHCGKYFHFKQLLTYFSFEVRVSGKILTLYMDSSLVANRQMNALNLEL